MLHVFKHSHSEEVLVTKIHPEYIVGQNIPGIESGKDITEDFWQNRYKAIRNFEKNLIQSGTVIMKFFLNVSRAERTTDGPNE